MIEQLPNELLIIVAGLLAALLNDVRTFFIARRTNPAAKWSWKENGAKFLLGFIAVVGPLLLSILQPVAEPTVPTIQTPEVPNVQEAEPVVSDPFAFHDGRRWMHAAI